MATQYRLTWREGEGRFRKRHRDKDYYFRAPGGKVRGYRRCLKEWRKLKAYLDATGIESEDQKKWKGAIALLRLALDEKRQEQDKQGWLAFAIRLVASYPCSPRFP